MPPNWAPVPASPTRVANEAANVIPEGATADEAERILILSTLEKAGANQDEAARLSLWVNFKVWGLLGITLAFTVLQGLLLAKHVDEKAHKGTH